MWCHTEGLGKASSVGICDYYPNFIVIHISLNRVLKTDNLKVQVTSYESRKKAAMTNFLSPLWKQWNHLWQTGTLMKLQTFPQMILFHFSCHIRTNLLCFTQDAYFALMHHYYNVSSHRISFFSLLWAMDISSHLGALSDSVFAPACCVSPH